MTVFFLDWDLWQEMTFVLACCIIAVFCAGTLRLWWNNRSIRKLEEMDEEKRVRRSQMRHCGIDTWRPDDIPFGVRALQTGVEVDGIWVSRSDTPDLSQIASSTTLMGDRNEQIRGKGKGSDAKSEETRRQQHASEASTMDQILRSESPMMTARAPNAAIGRLPRFELRIRASPEPPAQQAAGEVWSYLPSGWGNFTHQIDAARETPPMPKPKTESPRDWSRDCPMTPQGTMTTSPGTMLLYGSAEVHANRTARRANKDFEVLPAGSLGPRQELSTSDHDDGGNDGQIVRLPHFQPGPAKLRKKLHAKAGDVNSEGHRRPGRVKGDADLSGSK